MKIFTKKIFFTLGILYSSLLVHASDRDIIEYGALPDSTNLNTIAIQQAIDDCNKSGDGKVYIPEGKFLTGTLELKDNVTLHLKRGAVLLGSIDLTHFAASKPCCVK